MHGMLYKPNIYLGGSDCRIQFSLFKTIIINSSPAGQNDHTFSEDIFKNISMKEKFCILITISLKFVP